MENGKAIIIQMDGNLWAGPEIIQAQLGVPHSEIQVELD